MRSARPSLCCAQLSNGGGRREQSADSGAAFIKIFSPYEIFTSELALQGGDPYGLASEAALHRAFALSSDPASR
jgi:hypothetical protein